MKPSKILDGITMLREDIEPGTVHGPPKETIVGVARRASRVALDAAIMHFEKLVQAQAEEAEERPENGQQAGEDL